MLKKGGKTAGWLQIATALWLAAGSIHGEEEDPELEIPKALWDHSVEVTGAIGYKDNLLLSNFHREGSAFWHSGLDASLFRLSLEEGPNITLFLSGEDRRYFSSEVVDQEQTLIFQGKIEWDLRDVWHTGIDAKFFYFDQVYDASSTELFLTALQVKGQDYGLSPFVSRDLGNNYNLRLQFNADRQHFSEPLDDYWQFGPELFLTKKYGHKSQLSVSYAFYDRSYDTRQHYDSSFNIIPGSSLRYLQHNANIQNDHSWDEERRIRTRLRFGFEENQDNGGGYFDYQRFRYSARIGYYGERWNASIEGKALNYQYLHQPILAGTEIREFWEYVAGGRVEMQIIKPLKGFISFEHEWVTSNESLEEYEVSTIMGGATWEF